MIEDVPADTVMINHELRKGGLAFRSKRIESRDDFLHELEHHPPDVILSDHGLPSFDGFTALAIARNRCPDVPFIFVTSKLGEQMAIETFESGATDYVLKNNLSRLVPAVQRALREAEERRRLNQQVHLLRENEERLRSLIEGVRDYAIFLLDKEGKVTSWNTGAQWMHGYHAEEVLGRHFSLLYTHEGIEQSRPELALKTAAGAGRFEEEGLRIGHGGKTIWAKVIITALRDEKGQFRGFAHVTCDLTKAKQSEEALRKSEERYRHLVELCPDALLVLGDDKIVFMNTTAAGLLGADNREKLVGTPFEPIIHPDSRATVKERLREILQDGSVNFWKKAIREMKERIQAGKPAVPCMEAKLVRLDGEVVEVEMAAAPLTYQDHHAVHLIARDIAGRKRTQQIVRQSESHRAAILETAIDAIVSMDHQGKVQEWNPAAEQMFGFTRGEALGQDLAELIVPPYLRTLHRQGLARYLATGQGLLLGRRVELTASKRDGTQFPVEIVVSRIAGSEPPLFTGFIRDITERKQAEEEQWKQEALKSAILETALDAILFIDRDGLVQEWNPAAERIFGYSRTQVLGRPMDELIIPPALREVYRDGLTNYLLTGVGSLLNRPIELTLVRAGGEEFRAELAITRVSQEESSGCTALIRDITERKRAEAALGQSEERFRLLVENVKEYAIYMLDPEGLVASWNTGAQRIKGYQPEEIIGKPFAVFFPPEEVQQGVPQRILKEARDHGQTINEGWRVRRDGSRFWSRGILTSIRDDTGTFCGFSKVAHDMTERKRTEELVLQMNAELERRVAERTAQLESANQELEAFSYSVSHDLRSPLRHIVGYIDILQSEVSGALPANARRQLQIIVDSAKHMGELIDALLSFSRMGRSEMQENRVSLTALFEEARRELRRDIEGRSVEWQISALPEVHGDAFMLRQVFINLLSNALKYTRTRKKARIEIGAKVSERELVVHIRDNGVGFDMKYADKLFGVFQRLHRAGVFEGTGIGLANVRRIIHRHGGRTWAEGAVDGGATFYFSLPLPDPKGPP